MTLVKHTTFKPYLAILIKIISAIKRANLRNFALLK